MDILDQHGKRIMEGCKDRAREAGLQFDRDTLEYIVSNRDMLELAPKNMIPTLYDYWMHDVEVLQEKGKYDVYPTNPFETVINTRPAISFYNDNNPDWLNVMIFYHVLAHIDFFQNNEYFAHTWDKDFADKALADKRMIDRLRSRHGRWVDYVIEFSRGIDNITNFYDELNRAEGEKEPDWVDYFFDHFLQKEKEVNFNEYLEEVERFNAEIHKGDGYAELRFFSDLQTRYPEFEAMYEKFLQEEDTEPKTTDLLEFIMENSGFVNSKENKWMKSVMQVVRDNSLYFAPQIRTKTFNEGWASYWHERLFMNDDRIKSKEVNFARAHARVTHTPKVGLNPYAIGMRLIEHIKDRADKGQLSYEYDKVKDARERWAFDKEQMDGDAYIFDLRKHYNDFLLINKFVDQDFVDWYKLFVTGKQVNPMKQVYEYYIKSRNASDYKEMLLENLYHPPHITPRTSSEDKNLLVLDHAFEGKQLVPEYIKNVMIGIEYLWNGPVKLNTTLIDEEGSPVPYYYAIKNREIKGGERNK